MYDPSKARENENWARKNLREIVRHIVLTESETFVSIRSLTRTLGDKYGYDFTKVATTLDVLLFDGLVNYYVRKFGCFLIGEYAKQEGYINIKDVCTLDSEANK